MAPCLLGGSNGARFARNKAAVHSEKQESIDGPPQKVAMEVHSSQKLARQLEKVKIKIKLQKSEIKPEKPEQQLIQV